MLQTIRRLLVRPQCFRLGRDSPVGTSTRGFSLPSQGTHNNASERALRAVAIGRKNWLFAGSDAGGRTAAVLYSVTQTCKRHRVDPFAYLNDVLARLPGLPAKQLPELAPHVWAQAQRVENETPGCQLHDRPVAESPAAP